MGAVGTKRGSKFDKVGTIGAQIGPSGHYRGWILSKGGFGSKSGHMVWDSCICAKKVIILWIPGPEGNGGGYSTADPGLRDHGIGSIFRRASRAGLLHFHMFLQFLGLK